MWLDIKGYDYMVSDKGEIKSVKTGVVMKPYVNGDGYHSVTLKGKNGKRKTFKVHRLVAQAFIPNPENKPTVHHIDQNKLNNAVENLEWKTYKEQSNVHFHRKLTSIPVNQYSLEGEFIQSWPSQQAAAKVLEIPRTNINKCCQGKRESAGGYRWKYECTEA